MTCVAQRSGHGWDPSSQPPASARGRTSRRRANPSLPFPSASALQQAAQEQIRPSSFWQQETFLLLITLIFSPFPQPFAEPSVSLQGPDKGSRRTLWALSVGVLPSIIWDAFGDSERANEAVGSQSGLVMS